MKKLIWLSVLIAGFAITGSAQPKALSGVVVDQQSGEPLPGATIELSGAQKLRIISGLNGAFIIRAAATGDYKVKVFYIGYETYETSLNRQTTPTLRFELQHKSNQLSAVNVAGKKDKGGDQYSQLADRRADIIQNSVSARAIEISPDLTVANVTQRVSGVSTERSTNGEGQYVIIRGMDKRYIYTLVNGIKIPSPDNKNRYVPLDIFPADLLERLEVTKSLTPNMEGDGIGGAVNMIMKDAPAHFSIRANAALGYADKFFSQDFTDFNHSLSSDRSPRYTNGPGYQATIKDFPNSAFTYGSKHNPLATVFGLSAGGRFFHDKFGVLLAGSYQNNYRNVNAVFFGNQTDQNNGNAQVTSIENRQYSIQQQRSGLHAKLDYRIDGNNKISFYGAYLNLVKNEVRYSSDTSLELGRVGPGTGRISNSYLAQHDVQQISNFTLKGEHTIARDFSVEWIGAYSKAVENRPDESTLNLNTGISSDPSTGHLVQAPLSLDLNSDREFTRSTDEDKSGYLNLGYKSRIGEAKLDWQIGGMYRDKTRNSSYDDYSLRPTAPTNQQYDGDINHNNLYVYNGAGTADNSLNYSAKEKVGAAYAMLKIDWNKFLITGGARYEHTDLSWANNVLESVKGKTGSIKYYDVLPSGNIKYALSKKQALRLSYYSAISRPNFYEVIPHTGGDRNADYLEIGNSDLKRTTSDNFDLRYEYFPKALDQLLVGVFYKSLRNPIEYALLDTGTFTYYMPANFGTAHNYGFELDATKYFRWFGIKLNYTYTNSEISTSKKEFDRGVAETVDQTRPLQGQSKHIANLSLLFKDDNKLGLNAQLAFGYTSRRINTVSQYLDNDVWQKGFAQMDFSVEKKIAQRWYIYAKVNNILNTPYELELRQPYTGSGVTGAVPHQTIGKNVFVRKDTYGANYLLGVKFKL